MEIDRVELRDGTPRVDFRLTLQWQQTGLTLGRHMAADRADFRLTCGSRQG